MGGENAVDFVRQLLVQGFIRGSSLSHKMNSVLRRTWDNYQKESG